MVVQGHCGKRQGPLGSCYLFAPNKKPQRPLHHPPSTTCLGRCQVLAPAAGSGRFVPPPTGSDVIQATCASALFISAPKARMKDVHG